MRYRIGGLVALLVAVGIIAGSAVGPAGAAKNGRALKETVKAHLLSLTDLPAGWSVENSSGTHSKTGLGASKCLAGLNKPPKHSAKATVSYDRGSVPIVEESLATGRGADAAYGRVAKALASCNSVTLTSNGKRIGGSIGRMSFPVLGRRSVAYALTFTITKISIGFDLVMFQAKKYVGLIGYADLGTPSIATAEKFAKEAVAKAEGTPMATATAATTVPPTTLAPAPATTTTTTVDVPTTAASSPPTTAAASGGCHPLSNESTCYEPGEYCRSATRGVTGLAGDGESIICETNNGLRWEPA